jgi:hypothetical protein
LALVEEVLSKVQDQERSHAIIAEALPHFGEEEHIEPTGVSPQVHFLRGEGRHLLGGGLSILQALGDPAG